MISKNFKSRILTSFILFFFTVLIFLNYKFLIYSSIILSVLSLLEFFNLSKNIFKNKLIKIIVNFLFISYVSLFFLLVIFFSHILEIKTILFIILLGCIASDLGGYVFGKIFKGPKLTKISPNKTISGSIGSFVFTILLMFIIFYFYTNQFVIKLLYVSFLTSAASQFGDIFFSYLKRKARFKDTGNILPGHGGILDRLDSIYFGIPIGFLTLLYLF